MLKAYLFVNIFQLEASLSNFSKVDSHSFELGLLEQNVLVLS